MMLNKAAILAIEDLDCLGTDRRPPRASWHELHKRPLIRSPIHLNGNETPMPFLSDRLNPLRRLAIIARPGSALVHSQTRRLMVARRRCRGWPPFLIDRLVESPRERESTASEEIFRRNKAKTGRRLQNISDSFAAGTG